MALINCTECGKEISDKADTCPHCGCPVSQQSGNKSKNEVKAKSGVMDGVKIGAGIFIVLPLIIIGLGVAFIIVLALLAGISGV